MQFCVQDQFPQTAALQVSTLRVQHFRLRVQHLRSECITVLCREHSAPSRRFTSPSRCRSLYSLVARSVQRACAAPPSGAAGPEGETRRACAVIRFVESVVRVVDWGATMAR